MCILFVYCYQLVFCIEFEQRESTQNSTRESTEKSSYSVILFKVLRKELMMQRRCTIQNNTKQKRKRAKRRNQPSFLMAKRLSGRMSQLFFVVV